MRLVVRRGLCAVFAAAFLALCISPGAFAAGGGPLAREGRFELRLALADSGDGVGGGGGDRDLLDGGEKEAPNVIAWVLVCVSGFVIVVNSVVLFARSKRR